MKKLTCILLSLVICILMAVPSFANETVKIEPLTLMPSMDAYANDIVKAYMDVNVKFISSGDNFYLSQGFCIGNNTQACVYFLFNNEKCVGKLNVAKTNDEYVSSFVYGEIPFITTAYFYNEDISLIEDGESVFVIHGNYVDTIYGPKYDARYNDIAIKAKKINSEKIVCNLLNYSENNMSRSTNSSNELDVPIVENTRDPDIEKGLCWAASIASIVKYRKPSVGYLDAMEVYNDLKAMYNPEVYGYPFGLIEWEQRAFNMYYNNSISYTHYNSGLNYQGVVSAIDSNRPIYVVLSGTKLSTQESVAHAVVICGYGLGSARPYYRLMDPNEDYIVTVFISSGSSTNFTYNLSNYTYTRWARTYY